MSANPISQGNYVPARRFGNMIFTAGMTPRLNGQLILTGKVQEPLDGYRDAVRQAATNALTAARNTLEEGERIGCVLSITVYVQAVEGFTLHSKLADFASDFLVEEIGEAGVGSRAAVGVASLPGNAPVEISLVLGIA